MFSIMENIYSGWQYFMNVFSLIGGNIGSLISSLPKLTDFMANTLSGFSAPAWIVSTASASVSLILLKKICHWGC